MEPRLKHQRIGHSLRTVRCRVAVYTKASELSTAAAARRRALFTRGLSRGLCDVTESRARRHNSDVIAH